MNELKNYFEYHGFWKYFQTTNTVKELFWGGTAFLSLLTALLTICYQWWFFIAPGDFSVLNGVLKNILLAFGAGLIGLFGFLISGLAILTSMMSKHVVLYLDSKKQIPALVEILFSFFFEGAILALCILGMFFGYLTLYVDAELIISLFFVWGFAVSYLFWFAIFYGVGLLGTCINILFVNVKAEMDIDMNMKKEAIAMPKEATIFLEAALANTGIENSSRELGTFLKNSMPTIEIQKQPVPQGVIMNSAFDWQAVIGTAADLITVAGVLWAAYEKFIIPRQTEKKNVFIFVRVYNVKNDTQIILNSDFKDEKDFTKAFLESVDRIKQNR